MTPFYDPLIAKIIAWGEDRDTARLRLGRALGATAVLGVATNLGFLARIVADPDFASGAVDTGFIERCREALLPSPGPAPDIALAAAALYRLVAQREAGLANDDPWARLDGWRLNIAPAPQWFHFRRAEEEATVEAVSQPSGWRLRIDTLDSARSGAIVLGHDATLAVFIGGESWQFQEIDPLAPPEGADIGAGRLTAPMPGRVIELLVGPGAAVQKGQPMMVIEAMKMEHTIAAPRDGVVAAVHFAAGDLVEEGAELIALAESDAAGG